MYKHALLAVDLEHNESWTKSLPTAVEYAKAFGTTLHVITVVPDYGQNIVASFFPRNHEKNVLDAANKALHDFVKRHIPKEIRVQHIVGHGKASHEILRYAREVSCDVIIMASHRPKMEDYLLGPNAAHVVRHAKCSVLVVRE